MIKSISQYSKDIIDRYMHLNLYGTDFSTPYYINVKRVRAELRSLVGKGTPEEIIDEIKIFAQLRGFKLQNEDAATIRKFLTSQGIGIDCSGYISHILDYTLRKQTGRGLRHFLRFKHTGFFSYLLTIIRPIEHISSDLLTSELNASKIDYTHIEPGDMIRLKGLRIGDHVTLITDVEYDNNNVKKITYTHSSSNFGEDSGVKMGTIIVTDPSQPLEKQHWTELDKNGDCPTLKQYLKQIDDNGVVRPKFAKYLKC